MKIIQGLSQEQLLMNMAFYTDSIFGWKKTLSATIVGGLHGGIYQIALPIMADVRRDIERTLRGSRTTLETERYAMTLHSLQE